MSATGVGIPEGKDKKDLEEDIPSGPAERTRIIGGTDPKGKNWKKTQET